MIYLDHHATTPLDARVLEAMLPWLTERFGNPSSRVHRYGWEAGDAVEQARRHVARLVGAAPRDLIFTSGATEANYLAIAGIAAAATGLRRHVVTLATEHAAVLEPCRDLAAAGWEVTVLGVPPSGISDPDEVARAITPRTALVSVMYAHNEIGVLQPLAAIAAAAHAQGALVHTDAVQALGRVPVDVRALGVDLASFSAHKVYGPKGVGALYIRRGVERQMRGLIRGGGQERGLRGGTPNVPGIVGFGRACELAAEELPAEMRRIGALRDRLWQRLRDRLDGVALNGAAEPRLPGNLNVSFDGVAGRELLTALTDVAVSSGAACLSAGPSHVLEALGLPRDRALASLRFCVGRSTTADEVDRAASHVAAVVAHLRRSPAASVASPAAAGV